MRILLLLLIFGGLARANELISANSVPAGFEYFAEPQDALVDVYYQDRFIAEVLVSYDLEFIRLTELKKVIEALPEIAEVNPLYEQLNRRLRRNSDLACQTFSDSQCGFIDADSVAVIFDESALRLDLFINRRYLAVQAASSKRYLPEGPDTISSIHSAQLLLAGNRSEAGADHQQAVFMNSVFAKQRHHVYSAFQYQSDDQVDFARLSYVYELDDEELELGYFQLDTGMSSILSSQEVYGIRMRSHVKRRLDAEESSATPIVVFLASDSRVEVYRGQQLIGAQFLLAGNHPLNSESFPEGAYEIRVVITDNKNNQREERYFFSKSTNLPPLAESFYFFELAKANGNLENSQQSNPYLARFGQKFRLEEHIGLGYSAILNADERYLASELTYMGDNWTVQGEVGLSDHGNWIYTMNAMLNTPWFLLNSSTRVSKQSDDFFGLYDGKQTQRFLTASAPLGTGRLYLFYQVRNSELVNDLIKGINFRLGLGKNWTINSSWFNEMNQDTISIEFQYNFNDSRNALSMSSAYQMQTLNDDSTQRNTSRLVANRRLDVSESLIDLGLNAFRENDLSQFGFQARVDSNKLLTDFNIQRITQSTREQTAYSGFLNWNLASTGGEIIVGGGRNNEAGIVVEVRTKAPQFSRWHVFVNGLPVATVPANDAVFIPLSAYKTYQVKVTQASGEILDFDSSVKTVTIYPGSVERVGFSTQQVRIIVGRLVDQSGLVLANASLLDSKIPIASDEEGWFQVEVKDTETLRFRTKDKLTCELVFSNFERINGENIWLNENASCLTRDLQ